MNFIENKAAELCGTMRKRASVVSELFSCDYDIPLPLLSHESWMFMKENPDRKKVTSEMMIILSKCNFEIKSSFKKKSHNFSNSVKWNT